MSPFDDEKEFDQQEYKGLSFQNIRLAQKTYTSCVFKKCSFREANFTNCVFQDCKFQNTDLSLIIFKECTFKNVVFENSQLVGINWMDTNLTEKRLIFIKPVDFIECVLNHSTFMGCNLKNAKITRCIARDVSFEEADLSRADCTNTEFTDSRFIHTNLTETNFAGATNYSIAANSNTLHKTIFTLPDAMSLLYGLDIILKDQ